MNTAFVFPGQGAQYVGMGVEIADRYPEAKVLYNRASNVLGFDLLQMCRDSSPELLQQTENAQPAIFVTNLACLAAAKTQFPEPTFLAGLSLGEYSALVAADVIEFEDAVFLVQQRAIFMQEASMNRDTKMAAIIGLNADIVEAICQQVKATGVCQPTNYNTPNQTVIGGDARAVEQAIALAEQAGATKVVQLAVSGAFHTPLMQSAAQRLAGILATINICTPRIPVISNVTAQPITTAEHIRSLLIHQITLPVQWVTSIQHLVNHGVDTFIEFGPGKTISGLVKRNFIQAKTLNVENSASMDETLAAFQGLVGI
jgi:[acyl-carrier-protein] S-malonyltransferase